MLAQNFFKLGCVLFIIRAIALLLGLIIVAGPILVALMAASVEPSNPFDILWVGKFALAGIFLALGYLAIGAAPRTIAAASVKIRLLIACFMVMSFFSAFCIFCLTSGAIFAILCLSLLATTVWLFSACIWPAWIRSYPSAKSV
ncbi:MAG: hypothetical protein R8K20_05650 [Gallionellaceae bacterium]